LSNGRNSHEMPVTRYTTASRVKQLVSPSGSLTNMSVQIDKAKENSIGKMCITYLKMILAILNT